MAIAAIFLLAPTEETMGNAQRIVYIHVSVAWMGLASFVLMAATGGMYLFRRNLAWDHWSRAALEIGWLCCSLTLVTGSLWAHAAWNTWWTWDPRLTTAFVLWAMYSAALVLRSGVEDPHRRVRMGAIVAIVGVLDVPLVIMATRWFRGIHPKSPHMEPSMRLVLLLSLVCFTVFLYHALAVSAVAIARRRDAGRYGVRSGHHVNMVVAAFRRALRGFAF